MTNFFSAYGLFLAKSLTAVIAILATFGGIIAIASKNKLKSKEKIETFVKDDRPSNTT